MLTLNDAFCFFTEESRIMPGLSVACGTAGRALTALGGLRDEDTGAPLTTDSIFDLASLTKLFTALLVMRLREEGRLDLAYPVTHYAPQFVHLDGTTVDQVLGFEIALTTTARVDTQKTPEAGRALLFDIRPGEVTGRAYSDMHAMVLKHVIEGAARETLLHEVQRIILNPLGMADTFCVVPQDRMGDCVRYDREHRIERGRYILREGLAPGMPHDPKAARLYPELAGHAGLFSTMGDMVRLCQGLLQEKVVSRSTLIEMSRNRTGFRRADGTYQQYLGAQCYVLHPVQYFSEIPVYESKMRTSDPSDIYAYGLAYTSPELDDAVFELASVLPDMIRLAEVEKATQMMAVEIEKTRRRVNALEHVMIPQYQATIKMITMKLDEAERSSTARLMKVKDMMLEKQYGSKQQ